MMFTAFRRSSLMPAGCWRSATATRCTGRSSATRRVKQHPERVSEILLVGVTTTRRSEVDWLDWGMRRFLPAAFERFHALAPHASSGVELAAAYNRLLSDPDPSVRANTADAWCEWENAVISHEQDGAPAAFDGFVGDQRLAFVRICTHYFAHGAFLDEGALLNGVGKLAGIPGILIHGRLDLGAPLQTAWDLAKAWPDAELIITDAGHTGDNQTRHEVVRALGRFAAR
jgi:proline iminopeptidase